MSGVVRFAAFKIYTDAAQFQTGQLVMSRVRQRFRLRANTVVLGCLTVDHSTKQVSHSTQARSKLLSARDQSHAPVRYKSVCSVSRALCSKLMPPIASCSSCRHRWSVSSRSVLPRSIYFANLNVNTPRIFVSSHQCVLSMRVDHVLRRFWGKAVSCCCNRCRSLYYVQDYAISESNLHC